MRGISRSVGWFLLMGALIFSLMSEVQATPISLTAREAYYQSQLVGDWDVSTEVTWSDCPYVREGQTANSQLKVSDTNGVLYPQWIANEWALVDNKAIRITEKDEILWERSNKLTRNGKYWFVESKDKFSFDKKGNLVAESLVKQYLNGEFVGEYVTRSTLERADTALASSDDYRYSAKN